MFLNLTAFSKTGGIEKFNRAFLKALSDLQLERKCKATGWSLHDSSADEKYFDAQNYKAFKGKTVTFVLSTLRAAFRYDTIILGHINLAMVGFAIKKIFPGKQIILVAHGIEVWYKLSGFKDYIMQHADKILTVSNYTRSILVSVHKPDISRITVFPNTIDPYFKIPKVFKKPRYLLERYNLTEEDQVIFTLTRLSATEKYKGYDKIMNAMPFLSRQFPRVKYLLSGKSDAAEKARLEALKQVNSEKENILLTGFIDDVEVTDHYLLSDVFILPSKKEGFGIVFIEAMACGVPVIAGNKDGSVDALMNGALGYLIDPDSEKEICNGLETILTANIGQANDEKKRKLQQRVISTFGFETFKRNLEKVLE